MNKEKDFEVENLDNMKPIKESIVEPIKDPIAEPIIKVEKRGRHKKDCDCEKCKLKREAKENNPQSDKNAEDKLSKALSKFNKQVPPKENFTENDKETAINENAEKAAQISGVMLLTIIDFVLPMLILKIFGFFSEKYKNIKVNEVKLDKSEKADLTELADLVAKEYIQMNPLTLLTISLSAVYLGKIQILAE